MEADFDQYLKQRAQRSGGDFTPFDAHSDHDEYVDGLPRDDGPRSFLKPDTYLRRDGQNRPN